MAFSNASIIMHEFQRNEREIEEKTIQDDNKNEAIQELIKKAKLASPEQRAIEQTYALEQLKQQAKSKNPSPSEQYYFAAAAVLYGADLHALMRALDLPNDKKDIPLVSRLLHHHLLANTENFFKLRTDYIDFCSPTELKKIVQTIKQHFASLKSGGEREKLLFQLNLAIAKEKRFHKNQALTKIPNPTLSTEERFHFLAVATINGATLLELKQSLEINPCDARIPEIEMLFEHDELRDEPTVKALRVAYFDSQKSQNPAMRPHEHLIDFNLKSVELRGIEEEIARHQQTFHRIEQELAKVQEDKTTPRFKQVSTAFERAKSDYATLLSKHMQLHNWLNFFKNNPGHNGNSLSESKHASIEANPTAPYKKHPRVGDQPPLKRLTDNCTYVTLADEDSQESPSCMRPK